MAPFPSEDFCRQAVALLNEDPALASAAEGWTGDFGIVVETQSGVVAVYLGPPREGRLPAPEFLALAALEARQPGYFARANAETWRGLLTGALDPIFAIVQRRLQVRGDLGPVVARLHHRGLAERWLARVSLAAEP